MSRLSRYNRPYTLPLSKQEIRRALRLGLGRIYLHHQAYGLEEHSESLFEACLRNLTYDVQCEASRADWLLALLDETQEAELVSRLTEVMPRTRRRANLSQHFELCFRLAKRGHASARSALYDGFRVDSQGGALWGCSEILELDGAEGLLWLCRAASTAVKASELENVLNRLVSRYDGEHGKGAAEAVITQSARLKALHSFWTEGREPQPVTHFRPPQPSKKSVQQLSALGLLELIDATAGPNSQAVSLWSRTASDEQLCEMVDILAREKSVHRLRHILSIYWHRDFPNFEDHAERLLPLATHDDWHVRRRANTAFSTVTHPKLRALTLDHVRSKSWLCGEMLPLGVNLRSGDSALLAQHLRVDRNAYRHHCLISDLVAVCESNPWPEMLEVMMFVYQTSPCTNCRRTVHDGMAEASLVPEWVAEEWPYDVDLVGWD